MQRPRFSVIIPTYQRREVVLRSVCALSRQACDALFEVIVVVDGSDDGSTEALRGLDVPFPSVVLEQPNRGAATARNQGASMANGEILLFLDDDMEAHPQLLVEHDRSHREGADVVLGHLPLHPESPSGFLSAGIKSWAHERLARLSSPGATLTLHDLLTGQLSISQEVFQRVGGFDTDFTHAGSFGNEDVDFGYRLLEEGYNVVFNPDAISWQYYNVQPRQYLRQWHQAGQADVTFARKHPGEAKTLFALNGLEKRRVRFFWWPIQVWTPLAVGLLKLLRTASLSLLDRGIQNVFITRLFRETVAAAYWRGVYEAGGIPRQRSVRVLAYHAVADLGKQSVLAEYGVPPALFASQLDRLQRAGFHFVTTDEFLRFLAGQGGLPRRALLLTFDDCYVELVDTVLPMLAQRAIPAAVFAVSSYLGRTNQWDMAIGAPQLQLLDIEGLRTLAHRKIEIGAHSRTHPELPTLEVEELYDEIKGSIEELQEQGIRRPRLFAYPYGESDPRVQRIAREAGIQAAFTVRPGLVRQEQDPYRIPRIEILRSDTGWKFLFKVYTAGRLLLVAEYMRTFARMLRRFITF